MSTGERLYVVQASDVQASDVQASGPVWLASRFLLKHGTTIVIDDHL